MVLTATTAHDPARMRQIVQEVYITSSALPSLTPRSLTKIQQLATDGRLAVVYDGDAFAGASLAGWALIEPLTPHLDELGMTYIKPDYQGTEAFLALSRLLEARTNRMLLATYNPRLIRYAEQVFGWRKSSLVEVVWLSRGEFLRKRGDSDSRSSIRARMSKSKPLFAISRDRQ